MKLTYEESKKETAYMDMQDKLIQIRQIEGDLFRAIAIEKSCDNDEQRSDLNIYINSLQSQYALTHI